MSTRGTYLTDVLVAVRRLELSKLDAGTPRPERTVPKESVDGSVRRSNRRLLFSMWTRRSISVEVAVMLKLPAQSAYAREPVTSAHIAFAVTDSRERMRMCGMCKDHAGTEAAYMVGWQASACMHPITWRGHVGHQRTKGDVL